MDPIAPVTVTPDVNGQYSGSYASGTATDEFGNVATQLIGTAGSVAKSYFASPASLTPQAQLAAVSPPLQQQSLAGPLIILGLLLFGAMLVSASTKEG